MTFDICQKYVDDIVTVDESEISTAILWLLERAKTIAEGAGAVPTAALMSGKVPYLQGKKVAALVSGGNIDVNNVARVINNGLIQSWRKVYFSTVLPDQPGQLVKLLQLLAQSNVNVLSVTHERSQHGIGMGYTVVSLEVETANEDHFKTMMNTLKQHNYQVTLK